MFNIIERLKEKIEILIKEQFIMRKKIGKFKFW